MTIGSSGLAAWLGENFTSPLGWVSNIKLRHCGTFRPSPQAKLSLCQDAKAEFPTVMSCMNPKVLFKLGKWQFFVKTGLFSKHVEILLDSGLVCCIVCYQSLHQSGQIFLDHGVITGFRGSESPALLSFNEG